MRTRPPDSGERLRTDRAGLNSPAEDDRRGSPRVGHTVRGYIRSIYEKLHVHSKSAAVVRALKDRIL
jgi:hypothetical protein